MSTSADRPDRTSRRREVLTVLRESPDAVGVAEVARRLAVHPNTVRFHLDRLVADGLVENVTDPTRTGPGRPAHLFRAVATMDPDGPRHYRMLAQLLAEELAATPDPRGRATSAGRTWGTRLAHAADDRTSGGPAPLDRLAALLDDLGFDPALDLTPRSDDAGPDGRAHGHVDLRSCPFLEVARDRRDVVCPAHLGLMQGALAAWGAGTTVTRLDPFVRPDLCLAHLAPEVLA